MVIFAESKGGGQLGLVKKFRGVENTWKNEELNRESICDEQKGCLVTLRAYLRMSGMNFQWKQSVQLIAFLNKEHARAQGQRKIEYIFEISTGLEVGRVEAVRGKEGRSCMCGKCDMY